MNKINKKGTGRLGVLVISLTGFFIAVFAMWSLIVDMGTGYDADTEDYGESFEILQARGGNLTVKSEEFRDIISEDKEWTVSSYIIASPKMIGLIISIFLNIIPLLFASISVISAMLVTIGIPPYIQGLGFAMIVFFVILAILGIFRGKDV